MLEVEVVLVAGRNSDSFVYTMGFDFYSDFDFETLVDLGFVVVVVSVDS